MSDVIGEHREEVAALCRRFRVRRLEVFGSAATEAFDPRRSDLDFLVDFDVDDDNDLFHRYFGLSEALEQLFDRRVDLVMVGAMRNTYFIRSVNETRELIYAA